MKKVLIVVDMQKDFVDGSLGTKEAVAIVEAVYSDHIHISEYNWDVALGYSEADVYFSNINRSSSSKKLTYSGQRRYAGIADTQRIVSCFSLIASKTNMSPSDTIITALNTSPGYSAERASLQYCRGEVIPVAKCRIAYSASPMESARKKIHAKDVRQNVIMLPNGLGSIPLPRWRRTRSAERNSP